MDIEMMDEEIIDYTETDAVTETETEIETEMEAGSSFEPESLPGLLSPGEGTLPADPAPSVSSGLSEEMPLPETSSLVDRSASEPSSPGEEIPASEASLPADETSAAGSFSSPEEITPAQSPSAEVESPLQPSFSAEEAELLETALSLDGPRQGTGTGIRKLLEDLDRSSSLEAVSGEPFLEGTEYTVSDLYFQLVVSNRLLGIIAALLVLFAVWALIKFFVRLVADNITNHF